MRGCARGEQGTGSSIEPCASQDPPALPRHSSDPHQPPQGFAEPLPWSIPKNSAEEGAHDPVSSTGTQPMPWDQDKRVSHSTQGGHSRKPGPGVQQTCSPGELKAGDAGWEAILDLLETEEDLTQEMLHIPPWAGHHTSPGLWAPCRGL